MKTRDYYYDNIKSVLIVLVIFGHLIEFSVLQNETSKHLYTMIYYFHMPAFILISGYFAKKSLTGINLKQLLWKIGMPYVVFQLVYVYYHNTLLETELTYSLLSPYWILWFMFSFFLWHIALYLFSQFKYPLLWAFVVGLSAGLFVEASTALSLARTMIYFPFFLLGTLLEKKHFTLLKTNVMKIISIAALILFFFVTKNNEFFPYNFLWSSFPYETFGFEALEGIKNRALHYAFALVVMASLFSLIPMKKTALSSVGTYTIYIFLLHGFLIRGLQAFYPEFLTEVTTTTYFHYLFISIGFSVLITLPWIRVFFSPFVEPYRFIKK